MINFKNIILNTDSYKTSHYKQYPPKTEAVSSYIEARGGAYDSTLFFGLQVFLEDYLSKPITLKDIDEAQEILTAHGVPFYREGWEYILNTHNGMLPVEIEAVAEGTVVPIHNALVQLVNTDPKCYWLTSYLETALLRAVWYPTTVATISFQIKQIIKNALDISCEKPEQEIYFKLHDFGARGVSSHESAMIGGLAHLVNFRGTDTIISLLSARNYYQETIAGFSIPAAEHSTMTAWGQEHETEAFANMIDQFGGPGKLFAVVSDSYDIYNAVSNVWGKALKDKVVNNGGTLVIRPDSGEPTVVVLNVLNALLKAFGYQTNEKGYKVLPRCVRVIQGDGVNPKSIKAILDLMLEQKISAENIAFGMGGALLQQMNRDTCMFAMKANAVKINGLWRDIWKNPVTDSGKVSKRGRLKLIKKETGGGVHEFTTVPREEASGENILIPVYRDGRILKKWTLDEIRKRSEQYLK